VFLTEGLVVYGIQLGYAGDAVLFCTLGLLLTVALGGRAPVARATGETGRGIGAAVAWLLPVLVLGACGVAGLDALMAWLF
jgi:uncharacterized membrane protein YraQ (UPF0718 family)